MLTLARKLMHNLCLLLQRHRKQHTTIGSEHAPNPAYT
jgi:hypothetical protein